MQKIFIGDVQGCGDELEELLARAQQTFGQDYELWSVGDLINRGPRNVRALRLMRDHIDADRGGYVLGNHEIGLLRVWLGLWELKPRYTYTDVLEADPKDGWMDWIRNQRLAAMGEIEGSKFAMVHASVHPDWTLEELAHKARKVEARLSSKDLGEVRALLIDNEPTSDAGLAEDRETLGRLVRCRSVDQKLAWSKSLPEAPARPWHAVWSEVRHDYGVVYGHWSMQGLHVAPGLRGLDTGCVHNGRGRDGYLTAWLPTALEADTNPEGQFSLPDERFWQIAAHRRYYD